MPRHQISKPSFFNENKSHRKTDRSTPDRSRADHYGEPDSLNHPPDDSLDLAWSESSGARSAWKTLSRSPSGRYPKDFGQHSGHPSWQPTAWSQHDWGDDARKHNDRGRPDRGKPVWSGCAWDQPIGEYHPWKPGWIGLGSNPLFRNVLGYLQEFLNDRQNLAISPENALGSRQYNQLVIFGDSLSDGGNLGSKLESFGLSFPPDPRFVKLPAGWRISNGDLWIEEFASDRGFSSSQIANYAVIGATSGTDNTIPLTLAAILPPGTPLPPLPPLPGLQDEINLLSSQLGNQPANPNALYFVWAGGGDFLTLPQDSFANAASHVFQGVQNVVQSVIQLAQLGADTIAVANLPNLGRTPFAVSSGLALEGTAFSLVFNVTLSVALGRLEETLNRQANLGVDIVELDTFSLGEAIAANPSQFQFTNITVPSVNNPAVDPASSLFWDDFHPTAKFHQVISDTFEAALSAPTRSRVLETSLATASTLINSSGFRSVFSSWLQTGSQFLSTAWNVYGGTPPIGLSAGLNTLLSNSQQPILKT